ncbi:MAG TPA: ABC transporter ATP-binding protein [Parvularcula sp.]|nr:ABC transporter ATP-binding protein [Parvularcula sp.]HBS32446.1 ABC transporter ATP-binding protein [Parvularcula sp.]HBS34251.1 ABC transporter ATP-binding protein [Parvularcula sp.]
MERAGPKISIRGLKKSFGAKAVLRGVDLDLDAGTSLVVIGASGTGKSVLLKCILGIITPDAGEIFIDGVNILKASAADRARRTRQIGMLFQGSALFDSLRVWENVAFRLIYGERKLGATARGRAADCLAKVGLGPEVGDLWPSELSGGMQKRVALARAIAAEPSILFFDEPTTGLDPITADVINNLIVERVREAGATAISITHDMASARKIADDIAMLHEGRIIWRGGARDIDSADNPFVDQFVNGRADGPIKMALRAS